MCNIVHLIGIWNRKGPCYRERDWQSILIDSVLKKELVISLICLN